MAKRLPDDYLLWAAFLTDIDGTVAASKKQAREQKAIAKVHDKAQERYANYLRIAEELQQLGGPLSQQAPIRGGQSYPTEIEGQAGFLMVRNDPRLDSLDLEPDPPEPVPPVPYYNLLALVRHRVEHVLDRYLEAHPEAWRRGLTNSVLRIVGEGQ